MGPKPFFYHEKPMLPILFASVYLSDLWYAVPLILVISLVYSGTRHEKLTDIFQNAWRFALWMIGFLLIIFVVFYLMGKLAEM